MQQASLTPRIATMLEATSCSRVISGLTSKRLTVAAPYCLTRRQVRSNIRPFSNAAQRLATPEPPREAPRQHAPPTPDYVPSVKQLSDYAAKVGRMSSSGALSSVTEPYKAYGATEALYAECARQADYQIPNVLKKPSEKAPKNAAGEDIGVGTGAWFAPREQGGLALSVTFASWAQVMYLHLYILTVRLRRLPPEHVRTWEQHIMDHFYYAAEDKMEKWHGMAARGIRNKNLKDLWLQWRGALLSYDEGLIKGDAMLGAAVWRAIFKADINASIADVALVTAYLREELQRVDLLTDADLARGAFKFGNLKALRPLLNETSASMSEAFGPDDTAILKSIEAEVEKAKK